MMIRKYLSRHGVDARYPVQGGGGGGGVGVNTSSASKNAFVDEKSRECKLRFEKNDAESKSSTLSLSLTLPLPLSVALEEKGTIAQLETASGEKKDGNSELISALMMQLEHSNEALRLFMMENKRLKTLLAVTGSSTSTSAKALEVTRKIRRLSIKEEFHHVPNGVLLLSVSAEDRKYVLNLIHYASRFDAFLDTQISAFSSDGSASRFSNTTGSSAENKNNLGSSPNIGTIGITARFRYK